jgi:hypothetical protein
MAGSDRLIAMSPSGVAPGYGGSRRATLRPLAPNRAASSPIAYSSRDRTWCALRLSLGVLLLAAVALKAHELATTPLAGTRLFASRWLVLAVVQVELLLGVALIAGLWPPWSGASMTPERGTFRRRRSCASAMVESLAPAPGRNNGPAFEFGAIHHG